MTTRQTLRRKDSAPKMRRIRTRSSSCDRRVEHQPQNETQILSQLKPWGGVLRETAPHSIRGNGRLWLIWALALPPPQAIFNQSHWEAPAKQEPWTRPGVGLGRGQADRDDLTPYFATYNAQFCPNL